MTAPPPPPQKVQWRKAWRALTTLIDDPQRTDQVFELIHALEPPETAHPGGILVFEGDPAPAS